MSVSDTEVEEACWLGKPGLRALNHQDSSFGVKETVLLWNWSSLVISFYHVARGSRPRSLRQETLSR